MSSGFESNDDFKLNGDNYEAWIMKILNVLEEQDVLGAVSLVMATPEEGLTPQHVSEIDAYVTSRKNSTARSILLNAMEDDIAEQFDTYESARDIWIALKRKFGDTSLAKLRALLLKFDYYKMPYDHTLKVHLSEMAKMINELSDLGHKMTEEQKFQAVIRSFPNSWTLDDMKMRLIRTECMRIFKDPLEEVPMNSTGIKNIKSRSRNMKKTTIKL